MGRGWVDCDTTLRGWVMATCAGLQDELGASHVGTYLHGSLAAGSFYAPKSEPNDLRLPVRDRCCALSLQGLQAPGGLTRRSVLGRIGLHASGRARWES